MKKIDLRFGDCIEEMKDLEENSIDLIVTSPPYDNLRSYGNVSEWNFDIFKNVADQLFRITKKGGVIVWVVGDATIKGSESGTSFRQALHFKEIGFNLHDTMIYKKRNVVPLTHKRYEQCFEFMFVLSKGKLKTFNGIKDKCNKHFGSFVHGTQYTKDQTFRVSGHNKKTISEFGLRHNVFTYSNPGKKNNRHPATFPYQLAHDHIISWSNEIDVVLDPFMGSGTTGVACKNLNRNFVGIENNEEYFEIARERINGVS
jgi:site-specific DNA-methyltransferase (adenine-specific)